MRHLLLTEPFFPDIGGSVQLFHEIYTRFPPGELVHVLAGDWPGGRALDRTYPLPVTRFDHRRYEWMKPESAMLYARLVAYAAAIVVRERIDVVHAGRIIPEGLVALGLRHTLGVPYVFWVHGEEVSIFMRYAVKARLMKRIFAGARATIANSSFSRGKCLEAGAEERKVFVVNPAVTASEYEEPVDVAAARARFGVEGKTVLLTVGRLTRRKSHDQVMRAMVSLRTRFPDLVHLVASDGEEKDNLERLHRELGLGDRVRFLGPVSRKDIKTLYALCDVFIMANRTLEDGDAEGFGMVFLEANASGRPVIGGRSGGAPDAVVDGVTGLLVDGDDVGDIERAIATLVEDEALRRRMGEAGRTRARTLTWDAAARRVRSIAELGRPSEPSPPLPPGERAGVREEDT
ncbi:MAG: glycosyltransferase family 4 protein [Deltaproteobacteria bacterium]|nr:glycosyltransferase family 4 protein [Deltaproteobacteria bacterium]